MEVIRQKIARIKEYLRIINSIKDECMERFNEDPIYRGALLHYLYLLTDTCISLAERIIKVKKLRPPQSYHEAIDILGENGILRSDFAYRFAKIAGFRNFLAHDYEKIDTSTICNDILERLPEIEEYLNQVREALDEMV